MPKYAYYDHTASQPTHVIGWLDTDKVAYIKTPPASDLLLISDMDLWDKRTKLVMFVDNGKLVSIDPHSELNDFKAQTISLLTVKCQKTITGGFKSDALGSTHTYPSTLNDQANMQASVIASLLPNLPSDWTTPYWCEDSEGNWKMMLHTASQIQKASADGRNMIVAAQKQRVEFIEKVESCKTSDEVKAINWQM